MKRQKRYVCGANWEFLVTSAQRPLFLLAVSILGNQAVRSVFHDQAAFRRLLCATDLSFVVCKKKCGANFDFYESEQAHHHHLRPRPHLFRQDGYINKEERKEHTHAACVLYLMPTPAEMRFPCVAFISLFHLFKILK